MTNRRKLNVVLDSVVAVSAFLTDGLAADMMALNDETEHNKLFSAEKRHS